MSDVAARAGVAKTTLYRRWAGKNELVVDAVADLFVGHLRLSDAGSLQADIVGVVTRLGTLLERPETRTGLLAVVAESTHDPALRDRVRCAIVERQKTLVLLGRQHAQDRGELPAEDDPALAARQANLIFDVIAGAVVHRVLVTGEPVDAEWAETFGELVAAGLKATLSAGAEGGRPATGAGGKTGEERSAAVEQAAVPGGH